MHGRPHINKNKSNKMLLIISILVLLGLIILIRAFGSWMLRIDDIIDLQRKTLDELKKKQ